MSANCTFDECISIAICDMRSKTDAAYGPWDKGASYTVQSGSWARTFCPSRCRNMISGFVQGSGVHFVLLVLLRLSGGTCE